MKLLKIILVYIFLIGGIVLGTYVGVWQMFVMSIIKVCKAYDVGTLTGSMIGWCVFKCLFGGTVFSLIIRVGSYISKVILDSIKR